jgi:thiol:disulfide interchange protein DsbC
MVPQRTIESIVPAAMPGLYEAVVDGQVVYASGDGKFVFSGELWLVDGRRNATGEREDELRHDALAQLGAEKRIVFAAADPRHTVSVFTDFDCGYCRKLHREVAAFNQRGISIEYLLYPRGGPNSASFDKAVSVWCAADHSQAFTSAKSGIEPGHKVCPNPVSESFALGQRLGVGGAPTLVDEHGRMIASYLTPNQLLARLESDTP